MSEKGVLSKSIANNISEAIIDKLGGTGYAPTEWSKNINLLGISSADIEEALASITEDTSSSDKGLLSLPIASDMGAILNKKYNTSRGFRPSEVSSAVSALIPLPEKTTSSDPIADFSDGADDVPTKSLVVTIPPMLSGVSSVSATQTGRNLFDKDNANEADGYFTTTGFSTANANAKTIYIKIKAGETYTVSKTAGQRFQIATAEVIPSNGALFTSRQSQSGSVASLTITAGANDQYLWAWVFLDGTDTGTLAEMLASIQIEYGSAAHAYEPYTTPTTYTANLGRTIYGGTADIVNGTGTDENGNDFTFDGQKINTRLGYNAFWSDEGDTEVTYRADIDLYEEPSALSDTNNTETEGNEEQEVNE